jgi:hypothetical protein
MVDAGWLMLDFYRLDGQSGLFLTGSLNNYSILIKLTVLSKSLYQVTSTQKPASSLVDKILVSKLVIDAG